MRIVIWHRIRLCWRRVSSANSRKGKVCRLTILQSQTILLCGVEVKIGEFDFADAGQLGGYVVACNHLLRKVGRDNPTIGLLICKQKSNTLAQYALESSSQPLGISEYELEKLYLEKIEGTMPSIKEIEAKLDGQTND